MTVLKPITKEELQALKKREDDRRYWEGIHRAVEDIYVGAQKAAKRGYTYYVYPCYGMKESAYTVIQERVADLFPDSSVKYLDELDPTQVDCGVEIPRSSGRFIAAIIVDWA